MGRQGCNITPFLGVKDFIFKKFLMQLGYKGVTKSKYIENRNQTETETRDMWYGVLHSHTGYLLDLSLGLAPLCVLTLIVASHNRNLMLAVAQMTSCTSDLL